MIEQRTAAWHQQRIGKVTGSRVGAILGVSPYQKPEQVLRAMVREYHGAPSEFTGNVATEYGTTLEPVALFEYEMQSGNTVDAAPFMVHSLHDWLGASPDGIIHPDGLVEVKCPFSLRNGGEFKSIGQQPHYYAQMQIQMACTGANWCDFVQYSKPLGLSVERVEYDKKWFTDSLPVLLAFFHRYINELCNPVHLEPLDKRATVATTAAELALAEYDRACVAADLAATEKSEALARLVELCGSQNSEINGRKLTKTTRAGAVAYAKMVKDLLPTADQEPYRGAPSEYWQISKAKV